MLRVLLIIFMTLILSTPAAIARDNVACIQAENRTKACPHQLYRAMQLPGMTQPALRCICVTDFASLLKAPTSPEQRLEQLRLKQQFTQQLQHDIEPILEVLKRER
ncbi:hypothetical protein [Alishewanella tabrizica]|uniref:Secreted protein n=1 Tax=Alishewanella tabrizica TaxID=671278 RepID=A0ABQ2WFV0_9ALTE|nr:hypothetical protein [Alishewanella tabrizica]GGW54115.1 hypothetical protein GCM10008111_07910 [Alishewanella tabrizica]